MSGLTVMGGKNPFHPWHLVEPHRQNSLAGKPLQETAAQIPRSCIGTVAVPGEIAGVAPAAASSNGPAIGCHHWGRCRRLQLHRDSRAQHIGNHCHVELTSTGQVGQDGT